MSAKSKSAGMVGERGSVILSILLDTLVIVTAIGSRWVLLNMFQRLVPSEQHTFAFAWLERISDYGLVLTALVFTVFDLLKVIVRSFKGLKADIFATE